MGWLVAQGYEVTGITQDNTTVPPTNYFALTRQAMDPIQTVAFLCNSYTIAANEARFANEIRYNDVIRNWTEMINTSYAQFDAQTEEQNVQAGMFLTDLDEYMNAIETLIADNQSQIVIDAAAAKVSLEYMDGRLTELEDNAATAAVTINDLLSGLDTNVNTYVSEIEAILTLLDADYAAVDADLEEIKISSGNIGDNFATNYQAILDYLEFDYLTHEELARGFLEDLGSTETARINEDAAAKLSVQMQMLVSKGLYMSTIPVDVAQRNSRDRDENLQLHNDRLMREKLANQHQLYQQQFAMRTRMMDAQVQLNAVQQEVLKYQASLISGVYALLQENRNRVIAGKQAILAARDANARLGVLGGKERFSTLLMQISNALADHKHKAIAERLDTAVKRLAGWQSIADENRKLMAYQLDERNKLLIGLYGFVERRDDIGPEWQDAARMIAGLGDSGGGWVTP
jgi:hypothetical protein